MGLAASQARYLSLSARKTNTEYEGQQLNQQRLNLANQSADLFNQMLTMSVPTCPDSNDFTKLQYSWNDGINDEVISDYYQIAVPNEDFNYVVTSYHYEDVYTGQSKKMNSPEIQATKTNNYLVNPDKKYNVKQLAYSRESSPGAGDDSYTIIVDRNGVESTRIFKRVDSSIDTVEELDALTKRTTKAVAGEKAHYTPEARTGTDGSNVVIYPASWSFEGDYSLTVRVPDPSYDSTQQMNTDAGNYNMPFKYVDSWIQSGSEFKQIDFSDENQKEQIEQLKATYGDKFDLSKTYYAVQLHASTAGGASIISTGTLDGNSAQFTKVKTDEVVAGTDTDGTTPINLVKGKYGSGPTDAWYNPVTGKFYDGDDLSTATDITTTVTAAGDFKANRIDAYETGGNYYTSTTAVSSGTGANQIVGKNVESAGDVLLDAAGNPIYGFVCGEDMEAARGSQGEIAKVELRAGDRTVYYTDGNTVLSAEEISAINITSPDSVQWLDEIFFHSADNDPLFGNYTAVGNCKLNAISKDAYNSNEDMKIEIQQVIEDMNKNGNTVAFGNLSECFDSNTGEYLGGIYSFKMYDHTYYTTNADLASAAAGAYRENATATNSIDSQNKLMYYTSTYLNTKIEETRRALMETDGKGRFSSVKFEDDDTVYSLHCETITDEDAYNNAMNQYYYKQEQYDKAVADINAKTEIIQAEDRELQLRMEQLGTEQNALQTEMEACQKVVSKNVETSFKTFGG